MASDCPYYHCGPIDLKEVSDFMLSSTMFSDCPNLHCGPVGPTDGE